MTASHPPILFPLLITALLTAGCWLFGGVDPKNTRSPAAVDSIDAYRAAPEAAQYRARIAELELVALRQNLRPVFDPATAFSESAGGAEGGWLANDATLILDGVEGDWFGVQATRISPDLSQPPLDVFVRGTASAEIGVGDLEGVAFFGFEEPAAIALIKTDSFDAHIGQLADTRAGLRFCFFSQSMTDCEGGYEFGYDTARFQTYQLKRSGEAQSLCSYQMTTSNHHTSTGITVDLAADKILDPDIRISAHNGFIRVVFNGHEICDVEGQPMTAGYFLIAQARGIHTLDIDLNTGSSTFYAPVSSLVDVSLAADSLEAPQGPGYEEHNAFVSDYNGLAAALAGEAVPESFHHDYFGQLLGKDGADEAFALASQTDQIDAYLGYLKDFPLNSHRKEIEAAIWRLATTSNTAEGYGKYETQYPDSDRLPEVQRRLADLEWSQVVKKGSKSELEAYLSQHPGGYYEGRAKVLLAHEEYRSQNADEVALTRKILEQAQKTVDKSPITSSWAVQIIDFVDGTIHFNLNQGPMLTSPADGITQMNMIRTQEDALNQTCELLQKRHSEVETCVNAWSNSTARAHESIALGVAIQDAITSFYLPALTGGKELDRDRLLELLAALGQTDPGKQFKAAVFMAEVYLRLGMTSDAAYWFYRFALTAVNASDVNYYAKQLGKVSPSVTDDPQFKWVIGRFGQAPD